MANKKTFLLLQAMQVATSKQLEELKHLSSLNDDSKIEPVLEIYRACNVDEWAKELKQKHLAIAMEHLEEIAVVSLRKKPLAELAHYLMERDV